MAAMTKAMCIMFRAAVVLKVAADGGNKLRDGVSIFESMSPYVTNRGPLSGCCTGVKRLNGAAKTISDRRSVCTCLKSFSSSPAGGGGAPWSMRLNILYKISPSTDCSRVN